MKAKITVPYDTALSKNAMHGFGRGKVYVKGPTQAAMDAISYLIRPQCYGYKWTDEKIYVQIMVYRPDMRGDPQNFVDTVCDAIKVGIGRDDNIYAVSVDWALDEDNPHIDIEVEQKDGKSDS